jgi:hypothetical protein
VDHGTALSHKRIPEKESTGQGSAPTSPPVMDMPKKYGVTGCWVPACVPVPANMKTKQPTMMSLNLDIIYLIYLSHSDRIE